MDGRMEGGGGWRDGGGGPEGDWDGGGARGGGRAEGRAAAGPRVGSGAAPSRRRSHDAAPGMRRAAPGVGGGGERRRRRRRQQRGRTGARRLRLPAPGPAHGPRPVRLTGALSGPMEQVGTTGTGSTAAGTGRVRHPGTRRRCGDPRLGISLVPGPPVASSRHPRAPHLLLGDPLLPSRVPTHLPQHPQVLPWHHPPPPPPHHPPASPASPVPHLSITYQLPPDHRPGTPSITPPCFNQTRDPQHHPPASSRTPPPTPTLGVARSPGAEPLPALVPRVPSLPHRHRCSDPPAVACAWAPMGAHPAPVPITGTVCGPSLKVEGMGGREGTVPALPQVSVAARGASRPACCEQRDLGRGFLLGEGAGTAVGCGKSSGGLR